MEVTDFINGPVTYDREGQYFWVNTPKDGVQMLGELRGWGHIQNMNKKMDMQELGKYQDEIGEFVAQAINEKIQKLKETKI